MEGDKGHHSTIQVGFYYYITNKKRKKEKKDWKDRDSNTGSYGDMAEYFIGLFWWP